MTLARRSAPLAFGRKRIALVLGGGGMKGFAHIGVMQALEELGITPTLFAGTSIGALIGAAAAGGVSAASLSDRAISMRRRDLFRINHMGMIRDRTKAESIYLEAPLRGLVESVVPRGTFAELPNRLLVNTVDLDRATQLVWGTPGLDQVNIQDAVYASCSLPGLFPPGRVGSRTCVDGGVVDNLPAQIAAQWADIIIAVDVGSSENEMANGPQARGFAGIYMRSASTMMHALQQFPLARWSGPPMVLIRPRCDGDWLGFGNTRATIEAGYESAMTALARFDGYLQLEGGVHPRRHVEIEVLPDRCTGCGLCAALAPNIMGLDGAGRAFARTRIAEWSPADGDFVRNCPTGAIVTQTLGEAELPTIDLAS